MMKYHNFFTINEDWKADIGWGVAFAAFFIILNLLVPSISIGFPLVPQATQGERLLVIGGMAPIGEEIVFRGAMLTALSALPFGSVVDGTITFVSQIGLFSIYHVKAYAGSFDVQKITNSIGAFIGAAIFSLLATVLVLWRRNVLSSIFFHAIVNIYLFISFYKLFSIAGL